jgi:hypothetical protein
MTAYHRFKTNSQKSDKSKLLESRTKSAKDYYDRSRYFIKPNGYAMQQEGIKSVQREINDPRIMIEEVLEE